MTKKPNIISRRKEGAKEGFLKILVFLDVCIVYKIFIKETLHKVNYFAQK